MNLYKFKSVHVSARLKLKAVAETIGEKAQSESSVELVYKHSDESYVFIFHFGSIVFVNVTEERQRAYLDLIHEISAASATTIMDDFVVEEDSALPVNVFHETGFNKVKLRKFTYPILRLLALVMAESSALEYFENITEDLLNRSRRISSNLKQTGGTRMGLRDMVRFVGDCLSTKQDIITDMYVVDAPDETWEDQDLDRLYADIKKMYEIETRYRVLEFKLKLVQETVDVVVDLLRYKRQTVLELIIIGLIAVEVAWLLLQVFTQGLPKV